MNSKSFAFENYNNQLFTKRTHNFKHKNHLWTLDLNKLALVHDALGDGDDGWSDSNGSWARDQ